MVGLRVKSIGIRMAGFGSSVSIAQGSGGLN